jgi:uncharacterized protein (DUF1810 family)
MSVRYAIGSLAEAKVYLEHPLLGARLRECVAAMNMHAGVSASKILGEIDARTCYFAGLLRYRPPGAPTMLPSR